MLNGIYIHFYYHLKLVNQVQLFYKLHFQYNLKPLLNSGL